MQENLIAVLHASATVSTMLRFLLVGLLALSASGAEPAGLFVAVGYGGRRISSADGVRWENDQRWADESKDDDHVLFNVAFGHGRFIAVGGGAQIGHILSTRDGREWKALPPWKGRVATIGFGDDRFVAAHGAGLLHSSDGETFTAGARLEWKGSVHPRRSAFGDTEAGQMFVVIGDADLDGEGERVHWRASTTDGTTFASAAHGTPPARDVAHGAGRFVVVGPGGLIESSHDGQTWQRHPVASTDDFSKVIWTGRRFLVSGGQRTWSSPDALTWAPEPTAIPCSLAWGRENGGALGIGISWGGNMWLSHDLARWRKLTTPPGPSLQAVAFGQP